MDKKIYLGTCGVSRCQGPVHVIEPGDTLYSIAQRYHTRVRVLLALNPFVDIYNLQPGDEICIPEEAVREPADYVPMVIKKGETVGSLLKKLSMSFEELSGLNQSLAEVPVPEGMIVLIPRTCRYQPVSDRNSGSRGHDCSDSRNMPESTGF